MPMIRGIAAASRSSDLTNHNGFNLPVFLCRLVGLAMTPLYCVIASERFAHFAGFAIFKASEAIPQRVRKGVEVCAHDPGDCCGLPPI